ncbi:MAG TPA: type II toxin-antitoxin system RelE/ParE family toxin [Vicinamibacteria bacterium]
MTDGRSLLIAPRAAQQMREARRWWSENRPKAPHAFLEELRKGFELIRSQPLVGSRATNVRVPGLRRIHLSRVRYHLYYRVSGDIVEVLAFWHSSRGAPPPL